MLMKASGHCTVWALQSVTDTAEPSVSGGISQTNAALHSLLKSLGILPWQQVPVDFCSIGARLNATLPGMLSSSQVTTFHAAIQHSVASEELLSLSLNFSSDGWVMKIYCVVKIINTHGQTNFPKNIYKYMYLAALLHFLT